MIVGISQAGWRFGEIILMVVGINGRGTGGTVDKI